MSGALRCVLVALALAGACTAPNPLYVPPCEVFSCEEDLTATVVDAAAVDLVTAEAAAVDLVSIDAAAVDLVSVEAAAVDLVSVEAAAVDLVTAEAAAVDLVSVDAGAIDLVSVDGAGADGGVLCGGWLAPPRNWNGYQQGCCWYFGAVGDSCNQTCSARGGYDAACALELPAPNYAIPVCEGLAGEIGPYHTLVPVPRPYPMETFEPASRECTGSNYGAPDGTIRLAGRRLACACHR